MILDQFGREAKRDTPEDRQLSATSEAISKMMYAQAEAILAGIDEDYRMGNGYWPRIVDSHGNCVESNLLIDRKREVVGDTIRYELRRSNASA